MTVVDPRPDLACAATVHGLLAVRAAAHPDRECLVFEGSRYTYRQVADRSCEAASALRAAGIGRGDRVALMLSNRPEFIFMWFGCSMLGAVEVPINTAHKGDFLAYMLEQAQCQAIVAESAFWPQLRTVIERPRTLEFAVILDGTPAHTGRVRVVPFESLPLTEAKQDAGVTGSAPHAILFTSGTTGPSKGAVMPQSYPLLVGEIVATTVGYTANDVLYNALPLFHGNAQFLSTVPALLAGARIVLARKFSASQFWDDVRRNGCTAFNYIGGILAILMKAEPTALDRDHALRVMFGGGAPRELFRSFEHRFGVRLIEGYGMSEIGLPLMTTGGKTPPGSCGQPHPWYDVRLVDEAGEEVPTDMPGEALVRPRRLGAMMIEYYGMPERTIEAWRDLWFHTGDYLKRDEQGDYWFVDRKKDALRRRGENISSWEVEQVVNAHPDVLESAAIAVAADIGEDDVMVCVALRPDRVLEPQTIFQWCDDRMAAFMVPRYLRVMRALPKTPTERVQKFELRQQGVTADTFDRLAAQRREDA